MSNIKINHDLGHFSTKFAHLSESFGKEPPAEWEGRGGNYVTSIHL